MDVRLLDEHCFNNLSSCINNASDSVLYCLTVHEVSWASQVHRLVRCLSHSDFSLTLQNAEKLFDEGSCSRRAMHRCDCPTCKTSGELFQNYELESSNDTLIKVRNRGSKSMKFHYESVKRSESKSGKEELIKSVNNQAVGKSEIKAADISHCSITYISFVACSHLILLNV
ncbi:unnamed protein product [Litomosoides sigmodontis]|uniref:Uncharacterized protein n=1 Tax=Litomosoides sigmodontis TaxID=42156 RepID=A0A3P6TFK5_LITSI|nr:unnamed protein product [Litomosoides sigmodontis]